MLFRSYPDLADNCSSSEAQETLRRLGLELQTVFMESDAPRLYDSARSDQRYSEWIPTRPEGSGWFVLSIHDTDNGPVCQYVRPLGEHLSPIDLDAAAEQHERLLSEACAKALNQRDAALARVAALESKLAELEKQEPVAWGAFHFGGKRDGKLYTHCETEAQIEEYILDMHRSSDSLTLRKGPLYGAPVAQAGQVPQAWLDVQAERRRQITAEGWTPEHDDEHDGGELADAAACYALSAAGWSTYAARERWPWPLEWWKPSTARRDLVKACALGLAEIERLDRAAASQGGPHDA